MSKCKKVQLLNDGCWNKVLNTCPFSYKSVTEVKEYPDDDVAIAALLAGMAHEIDRVHCIYDTECIFILPEVRLFALRNVMQCPVGMDELPGRHVQGVFAWKKYFPDSKHNTEKSIRKFLLDLGLYPRTTDPSVFANFATEICVYASLYDQSEWEYLNTKIIEYRKLCNSISDMLYAEAPEYWEKEPLYPPGYWSFPAVPNF